MCKRHIHRLLTFYRVPHCSIDPTVKVIGHSGVNDPWTEIFWYNDVERRLGELRRVIVVVEQRAEDCSRAGKRRSPSILRLNCRSANQVQS